MELICRESYVYASQKGQQNFDLDVLTLKLFVAILLLGGFVLLPRRPMYWKASGNVHNLMVSGAMFRNTFSAIIGNVHFANNNSLHPSNKFAKVCPLLDHVNSVCLTNFHPEQILSVDESMVPYFGHHGARRQRDIRLKNRKRLRSISRRWFRRTTMAWVDRSTGPKSVMLYDSTKI